MTQDSKQIILKEIDNGLKNFDGLLFSSNLFKAIESFRSLVDFNSAGQDLLNLQPSGIESVRNCFFRILGMPAYLSQESGQSFSSKSQNGTLNYFDDFAIGRKLLEKELLLKNPDLDDFCALMQDPLSVKSSFELSSFADGKPRKKPTLFPLGTLADAPVLPNKKKTNPINLGFTSSETAGKCFIENIIKIRTSINELNNIKVKEELIVKIESTIQDENSKSALTDMLNNSNNLELIIISKFIKAINSCKSDFINAKQLFKKNFITAFNPSVVYNFNDKSIAAEDPTNAISRINRLFPNRNVGMPILDLEIESLRVQILEQEALISLMPQFSGKELASPLLSQFLDVLTVDITEPKEVLKEKENKRAVATGFLDKLKSKYLLYTGETIGINVFEILAVMAGLFTISLESLVGLLNDVNYKNLKINISQNSIADSLSELENSVKEYLKLGE